MLAIYKQDLLLPFLLIMAKELTIKGSMALGYEFPDVIEMADVNYLSPSHCLARIVTERELLPHEVCYRTAANGGRSECGRRSVGRHGWS